MSDAKFYMDVPNNEPVLNYAPGSPEKTALKEEIERLSNSQIDIPLIIDGKEVKTGRLGKCVMPHEHGHVLATYHQAGPKEVEMAIDASSRAWERWSRLPWHERVSVFLKAADLLSGPWRATLTAATILGQSKTSFQAEIDSACELIDFFRFNAYFTQLILEEQPISAPGIWNRMEWRPLEGFIFSITPFNFTAIAGNLPSAPAMLGNTSIWKPASSAVYSGYYVMKLFEEAGLPPGVINFIPGPGRTVGDPVLTHPKLAGVHFTGSTATFRSIWKTIGNNIEKYGEWPRIVGETGGKDFVFAHSSANVDQLGTALVRGAFEYQGQKCSAASRAYIPYSIWDDLKRGLLKKMDTITVGDPRDFRNFMGAVIDEAAFDTITGYIDYAKNSDDAEILCGGEYDKTTGYFIQPTIVVTSDPHYKLMEEEIFGPVLTIYVYPTDQYEETLELCDTTSPYALTGAVFAQDRFAVETAHRKLQHAAGNFYVNDKPTGAVVGQQPFGGARASGTNDKAGSKLNLLRWASPRTIKETLNPPTEVSYPHMAER